MPAYRIWCYAYLLVITFSFRASAQQDIELPGIVVEQNSKIKTGQTIYLQGASIKSAQATPQLSDALGRFKLVFADIPFGNSVRVEANKDGYEVVNEKLLEAAAVAGRRVPFEIVMCKKGLLYESQIAYYRIVSDAMRQQYENRIKILEQGGKNKDDLIARLQTEMNREIKSKQEAVQSLGEQYQAQQAEAGTLAKGLGSINLDDESANYRKAFEAFQSKDIDRAIALLDTVNLKERLASNTRELKNEESEPVSLKQKQHVEWLGLQIRQDISQSMFKARLHILKSEEETARESYKLALQYDSSDIGNLWEIGSYFLSRGEPGPAKKCFDRILALQTLDMDRARTLTNLAKIHQGHADYEDAESYYLQALKLLRPLYEKDTAATRAFISEVLANTGLLYMKLQYDATAENYLTEADEIFANSYSSTESSTIPQDEKIIWSEILQDQCLLFIKKRNYFAADRSYYNQAVPLLRSISGEGVEREDALLAQELFNWGIAEYYLKNYEDAGNQFAEALDLEKKRYTQNPDLFAVDWSGMLNRLGMIFFDLKIYDKADELWTNSLGVARESYGKNASDACLQQLSSALSNLGLLRKTLQDYSHAEAYYTEALQVQRQLVQKDSVGYLPGLAEILAGTGSLYTATKNYSGAHACFAESFGIFEKLSEKNPDVYSFDLAILLDELGKLYQASNDDGNAGKSYLGALKIQTDLVKKEQGHVNNEYELSLYLSSMDKTLAAQGDLFKKGVQASGSEAQIAEANKWRRAALDKMGSRTNELDKEDLNLGKFLFALGVFQKAEECFSKARDQFMALEKTHTGDQAGDYKNAAMEASLSLLYTYRKELESSMNFSYRDHALSLLQQIPRPGKDDYHQDWRQELINLDTYFHGITKDGLQIGGFIQAIDASDSLVMLEKDVDLRVKKEEQIRGQIEAKYKENPGNDLLKSRLSKACGNLSWFYILAKKFPESQQSAERGLALDPKQKWIYSNLALAFLLQNRWPEAKKIYADYKDQADDIFGYLRDIFLKDLSDLREAGLVYPQMRDAEEFLRQ